MDFAKDSIQPRVVPRRSYRSRLAKSAREIAEETTLMDLLLAGCLSLAVCIIALLLNPAWADSEAVAVRANMEADDMCHAAFGTACRLPLPPTAVALLYRQMLSGKAVGLQVGESHATPWLLSHARTLITLSASGSDGILPSATETLWQGEPKLAAHWKPITVSSQSTAHTARLRIQILLRPYPEAAHLQPRLARMDIGGIMALYRQPLDFIIVPASAVSPFEGNVLPALLLLLKSRGASIVITGVERGLEDEALSALPKSWESAVIGRSMEDGTVTIGSLTAAPFFVQLKNFPALLVESARAASRQVTALWNSPKQFGTRLVYEVAHISGLERVVFGDGNAGLGEYLMDSIDP